MEARATLNGPSVSKTFVAAVLVLVAMGLGAMGGYVVKGLGASGASTTVVAPVHPAPGTVLRQDNPAQSGTIQSNRIQKDDSLVVNGQVHPAPGTVLRQDNPVQRGVELPSYIQNEIDRAPATSRLRQDDPAFIQKYAQKAPADDNQVIGTRGNHGELQ